MEEHLEEAHQPGVVDLDAGDPDVTHGDRLGQALEYRKVHVDVQQLSLKAHEAVRRGDQLVTERRQHRKALLESEIVEAIDADLHPKERAEFLVDPGDEAFAIDAQHKVAVIDFLEHRVQLPAHALVLAHAEDLGHHVSGQAEDAQLAGPLEEVMNRKGPSKHKIPAVLDLIKRILAAEIDRRAIRCGKLRSHDAGPIVEAFPNDRRTEPIRGGLQFRHIAVRNALSSRRTVTPARCNSAAMK